MLRGCLLRLFCRLGASDQSSSDGGGHGGGNVGDLKLFVDVRGVEGDGAVADAKLFSDFLFHVASGHEFEDLLLALA